MDSDTAGYLRVLRRRGYDVPDRKNGNGHIEVYWQGVLVTTHSGSRHRGRGFENFKARIRAFEQGRDTHRVLRRGRR